jgi:hypothetical protein
MDTFTIEGTSSVSHLSTKRRWLIIQQRRLGYNHNQATSTRTTVDNSSQNLDDFGVITATCQTRNPDLVVLLVGPCSFHPKTLQPTPSSTPLPAAEAAVLQHRRYSQPETSPSSTVWTGRCERTRESLVDNGVLRPP